MMKSYVDLLKGLYTAILEDVAAHYPEHRDEWNRDLSRLSYCVEKESLSFFTLTLPACGKHLEQCLEAGSFHQSGLAFQTPFSPKTTIPGLFRALLLKVFDRDGALRINVDTQAVRFLRQLYYAGKKIRLECSDAATNKAVAEFFDIERGNRLPTLLWDSDDLDAYSPSDLTLIERVREETGTPDMFGYSDVPGVEVPSALLRTIEQVADRIVAGFGEVEQTSLRPKHGPGAVADAKAGVSKYSFPSWPAKLDKVFPVEEFAYANLSTWEHSFEQAWAQSAFRRHEPPSKLIAVPKTMKGPRLIAAEPTSHQWMQQALKRDLEGKVRACRLRHCIDFKNQSLSGQMALRASLDKSLCTIDLSSASDRLTCWLVERIFRANFSLLRAFHAVRTRWLTNPINKKLPKFVRLKKFAAQGSALTFPVQSIVYAIITLATLLWKRNWGVTASTIDRAARQVRVFGDDIIAPNDIFRELSDVLTHLGLKVNQSKSFSKGNFRESCGTDAYYGVDVTPAYVYGPCQQSRPESVVSMVACSNNFQEKGYYHAAAFLRRTVPRDLREKIPEVSADSGLLGWLSYWGTENATLKKRFNPRLHRMEVRALVLSSRVLRTPIEWTQALLQYFTEEPEPDTNWENGIGSRPKLSLRLRWVPTELLHSRDNDAVWQRVGPGATAFAVTT